MSHVEAAAEALEEATSWEASDPQDVHDTIAAVPRIPEGAYGVLDNVASRLEEHPNIDPAMVEAIREAAGQMQALSDQLKERLDAGVMPG